MIHERVGHGCVKLDKVIWVTGGWTKEDSFLNSTEFLELDKLNEGWKEGTELPYSVAGHRMVASEDMKTAYITGGQNLYAVDDILELICTESSPSSCAFKPSKSNMKINRSGHVALPISNEIAEELCS